MEAEQTDSGNQVSESLSQSETRNNLPAHPNYPVRGLYPMHPVRCPLQRELSIRLYTPQVSQRGSFPRVQRARCGAPFRLTSFLSIISVRSSARS